MGSPLKVQWINSRSPTVTPRIYNVGSQWLSVSPIQRVDNSLYQWYAEFATLRINNAQSWQPFLSTMQRVFEKKKSQKWLLVSTIQRVGDSLYQRYTESATPCINDVQSWCLPASLIVGSRFLIMNISANVNAKLKRLQQLCQGPVPTRLISKNQKVHLLGISL